MKNSLLILLLLSCNYAFPQINDTFNDDNFTENHPWQGQTSAFFVNSEKQLQTSLSNVSQIVALATASNIATNAKWEFFIRLDFDPSTTNQLRIYLIADKADLKASLNGYFIQTGESAHTDSYDLYRQNGNTVTKIINGPAKPRPNPTQMIARIQVTRNNAGLWELKTDNTGGTNYVSEGTITDNSFTSTSWFGVHCKYSASRSDKFIFDDFKVETLSIDTIPPKLIAINVIDSLVAAVVFNEPLDSITAKSSPNYILNNGVGYPATVATTSDPARYLLHFTNSLNTGDYSISVNNVKDRNGNTIRGSNTINFKFVKPYVPKLNDVVINEIFADPSPQVDLPTVEFIELWNTTAHTIDLKNWIYSDGSTNFGFTKDSIKINEHLILCAKADTNEFKTHGRVLGISPWPSLNNSGDQLILKSEQGTVINKVSYSDDWYKDVSKKSGGWTLELIDPKAVCSGVQNWNASKNISGGTPGKQNSIYQPNISLDPFKLLNATLIDSVSVLLTFNRFIDSLSATKTINYFFNNGVGNPSSAMPVYPFFEQVILKLTSPLTRGNTFKITSNNVADCAGSLISSADNSAEFLFAKKISKDEILINEILFNPRPNGVDFVEIYNNSDHVIDLKDLSLATLNHDTLSSLRPISLKQLLLQHGEYLVLTTNPDNIKQEYGSEKPHAFLKMASLPAFNDDAGTVILVSNNLRIDQLNYTDKMQFKLIKDAEGVSLERSSFSRPTNDPGNFRSATSSVGFATPGYRNSQYSEDIPAEKEFSLTSKTFSPDNDGFEDALQINYRFAKPGFVANVTIYNDQGILIRKLIKNRTIETEGAFNWDGSNELTELAPMGIYVVYAEFFDQSGKLIKHKTTCALAARL